MNKGLLLSLGITGNEEKLYNAVIKTGRSTPAVLAKITGIKRTTAYHTARILVEKGLLIEDMTKRPREFTLASAQDIQELAKRERGQFNQREGTLNELASELSRLSAKETYPVPNIRFVEEDKLRQFLYNETPKWHKSTMKTDATWWGFQDHSFIDYFGKVTTWYWKRTKEEFFVKLLSNTSGTEKRMKGKYSRRQIKFWNRTSKFLSTTWIVGDYVVMINTRNHPFYLVEIHDAVLANDQREIFKNLWNLV